MRVRRYTDSEGRERIQIFGLVAVSDEEYTGGDGVIGTCIETDGDTATVELD